MELTCLTFNLFRRNNQIINILSKLSELKKLSIKTRIENTDIMFIKNGIKNTTLKSLELTLKIKEMSDYIAHILTTTLASFVGINHFMFQSKQWFWNGKPTAVGIECWNKVFSSLFEQKTLQLVNNGQLYPLESLDFTVCTNDAISIIKCLKACQLERNYNVKQMKFTLTEALSHHTANKDYNEFIAELLPFFEFTKIQKILTYLRIDFGVWSPDCYNDKVFNSSPHFNPIIKLLKHLPSNLQDLKLALPYFDSFQNNRKHSLPLVKQLSKILSEKNGDSKLESIVLNKIKFCNESKNFLNFMFGYNNNIHIQGSNKYHLYFR